MDETVSDKTLFGRNRELKLVTAKSINEMSSKTGIPKEEMFGTPEKGEKF